MFFYLFASECSGRRWARLIVHGDEMMLSYIRSTIVVAALAILSGGVHVGGFHRISTSCRRSSYLFDSDDTQQLAITAVDTNDALVLLNEATKLRQQANELQMQLNREKEERIRVQREKVDSLIDALLFHGMKNNNATNQQLLLTEDQVAKLLISKRFNYEMVNQMFDRICELANRPQSVDSCSPLLSLLLDAACKVDCLERDENPNKRWRRVEQDLRKKLFLLGYGIRLEDVDTSKDNVRSITGEKDYS
jgi:hypothetical protein